MTLRTVFLLLTASFFALNATASTIEDALALYKKSEFEKAYSAFQELATIGNARAQYNIAVMYVRGEHVATHYAKAHAWARLAKSNGADYANQLIDILDKQLDEPQTKRAETRYRELAQDYAASAIAQQYWPQPPQGQSPITKAKMLAMPSPQFPKSMAKKQQFGWVDVQYAIGSDGSARYFSILNSPAEDFSEDALRIIKRGQFEPLHVGDRAINDFGNVQRIAYRLRNTTLEVEELTAALEDIKSQAVAGGSQEKLRYSLALSGWSSITEDMEGNSQIEWDNPQLWMLKAAQAGSIYAQYKLGLAILSGRQCAFEPQKAQFWLASAAEAGLADAQIALGYEYMTGARLDKNRQRGLALIARAAEGGVDHARVYYAWLLATHPDKKQRRADLAAKHLDAVDRDQYSDKRSYWETRTAVAIALENWDRAEKALDRLAKINRRLETPRDREEGLRRALDKQRAFSVAI